MVVSTQNLFVEKKQQTRKTNIHLYALLILSGFLMNFLEGWGMAQGTIG